MTQEQREKFVTKWAFRYGQVSIAALIIYFAMVFATAYSENNVEGAAFSFGGLLTHTLIAATFIRLPDDPQPPQVKVEHRYHRIHRAMPRGEYVYVIKDVDISGYYKIGRTTDLYTRLSTFEVKLPFEIEVIAILQCGNAIQLERELHRRFASKRVKGEWFNLSTDDLEAIRGIQ
jgi:hypothetical protein